MDPIVKERLFGLTNSEGNHGEDVKEYYFYLDSTPTHSYMTSRVVHADHGRSGMGRKARWTKGGWSNDGQQSIVLTMPSLICVIDDDRSVLRALRRLLWAEAFAVEAFGSAEEFLASEHRANARCLVLDVNLTGRSGLELQEQLLLTGAAPPIVFITAYDDRVARERACRAGAVDYLRKPFDDTTLLDAINRAIRGS